MSEVDEKQEIKLVLRKLQQPNTRVINAINLVYLNNELPNSLYLPNTTGHKFANGCMVPPPDDNLKTWIMEFYI